MAIDIRRVSEDDLDRAHFIDAYSFTADRSREARERLKHVEAMGPTIAVYEDGEMVACLRILPLRMFMHGASIPLGGVSSVACLPEHRRKGYAGRLLRHSLALIREHGQPLSSLYTPHVSLYRRYGWMIASSALRYSFDPKDIAPASPARPEGSAHRVTEEEQPTIAEVYRQFATHRNGYLDRDERWWREAFFRRLYDEKRRPNDVAVWADGKGRPRGYVAYFTTRERRFDGPSTDRLAALEFVALDSTAYLGLLRYLLTHDLAEGVTWFGPVDEPFSAAINEPGRVKREHHYGFMLRIVDLEKAIAVRPPAAEAPEGSFTIHIADSSAPWNQGLWRIECSGPARGGGRLTATKADGAPDISTDAAAFAAMYNGFLRPSEAARSGLAEVGDPRAAALADHVLAADYPPYSSEFF
jgi:predicted acetyltransferase